MFAKLSGLTLLAQYSNWQRLGDGLHRPGSRAELADLLPLAIIIAVLAAAGVIANKIYKSRDFSKPCDDPQKLFRQLCLVHGIRGSNKRLLLQLASANNLHSPAILFVTPAVFRSTALPDSLQDEKDRIQELGEQIF